eukprot:6184609-Pleurochrysis_carterae.AAC.2
MGRSDGWIGYQGLFGSARANAMAAFVLRPPRNAPLTEAPMPFLYLLFLTPHKPGSNLYPPPFCLPSSTAVSGSR